MNKKLLNIGGGKSKDIPSFYDGWEQDLLDIDPNINPDILCDAKDLNIQEQYDAVYISHTLEHFYKHEVPIVLNNSYNALKEDGRIEICSPDLKDLILKFANSSLDIDDVYYRTGEGFPVTFHDVIYGWSIAMSNGNLFYAHKCGFTPLSMSIALNNANFKDVVITSNCTNLVGIGYKRK